jgi:steroid delta-isomerase-like uncharacterized protein
MSTETNKTTARRFFEAMNEGDIEGLAALVAEDLVNHSAIPEAQGRSGLRTIQAKVRKAFPDGKAELKDVIAEGDKVTCRVVVTGTNSGSLDFVRVQIPATGRRMTMEQIHIFRMADGLIVEHWACRDDLAFMRQLGLVPTQREGAAA